MKRLLMSVVAMATVVSCTKDVIPDKSHLTDEVRSISVEVASNDASTRVTTDENWNIFWEENESLLGWSQSGDNLSEFTMSSSTEDGSNAYFQGNVTGENFRLINPYNASADIKDGIYSIDLSYQSGEMSATHMVNKEVMSSSNATTFMMHVGAAATLTVYSDTDLKLVGANLSGVVSSAKVDLTKDVNDAAFYTELTKGSISIMPSEAKVFVDKTAMIKFNILPFNVAVGESIAIDLIFEDESGVQYSGMATSQNNTEETINFARATHNNIRCRIAKEDITKGRNIYTAGELANIAKEIAENKDYPEQTLILANDIDLKGYTPWEPIGSDQGHPFKGVLDGNGKTISGLTNESVSSEYFGLIGYADGATIKNIIVLEPNIATVQDTSIEKETGAILGYGKNTTISNCAVIGGIVKGCCWDDYTKNDYAGGIAGHIGYESTIVSCYNTAEVSGASYTGGILGYSGSNKSTLKSCFNVGKIIKGESSYNICGINADSHVNIVSCYYMMADGSTCDPSTLATQVTFLTELNDAVEEMNNASDAEYDFKVNATPQIPSLFDEVVKLDSEDELDIVDGVCQISDEQELLKFAEIVNSSSTNTVNAKLLNDITLTALWSKSIGAGDAIYRGTFDGNGKKISGLRIDKTVQPDGGFFGEAQDATIKNLILVDPQITTANEMEHYGALASKVSNSNIVGCVIAGGDINVVGDKYDYKLGGLVGYSYESSIRGCYNTASLTSSNRFIGGLVGECAGYPGYKGIFGCFSACKISFIKSSSDTDSYEDSFSGTLAYQSRDYTYTNECYYLRDASSVVYTNETGKLDYVSELNDKVDAMNGELNDGDNNYTANTAPILPSLHGLEINFGPKLDFEIIDGVCCIATEKGLFDFLEMVNASQPDLNAKLTADITLTKEWPMFTLYRGTFDGNKKTISGLTINADADLGEKIGFFRELRDGAVIKNLILDKPNIISSEQNVGAIAGYVYSYEKECSVIGCAVIGGMVKGLKYVGGMVGYGRDKSNITSCYNTSDVIATYGTSAFTGGIIGGANDCSITSCYNAGKVSSTDAGGIIGNNYRCTTTSCYYIPKGPTELNEHGTKVDNVDALNGVINNMNAATDVKFTANVAPQLPSLFGETAEFIEDPGYEIVDGVYQITTETGLINFGKLVNDGENTINGKLMNDITLNAAWAPIGAYPNKYKGMFDGNGKTISGLSMNTYRGGSQGLFGEADGATLKNIILNKPSLSNTAGSCMGGILADGKNVKIHSCVVIGGTIQMKWSNWSSSDYIGGIAGKVSGNSEIISCYNSATIKGRDNIGGIVGYFYNRKIHACYNVGAVTTVATAADGPCIVGAIIGYFGEYSKETDFKECYYIAANGSSAFTNELGSECSSAEDLNSKVGAMNSVSTADIKFTAKTPKLPSLFTESLSWPLVTE